MQKVSEKEALNELNKIYTQLKSEVVHEMQNTSLNVSDVCYDVQLSEDQFVEYLTDKSDVGFCVDVAKTLIKTKKANTDNGGNSYGKNN